MKLYSVIKRKQLFLMENKQTVNDFDIGVETQCSDKYSARISGNGRSRADRGERSHFRKLSPNSANYYRPL